MNIKAVDSITLVVADVARAMRFYHEVFDLPIVKTADNALMAGKQELLFVTPEAAGIHAETFAAGTTELALATKDPLDKTLAHLTNYAVEIADGPIEYVGANGSATALWLRDYDQNLIKLVIY